MLALDFGFGAIQDQFWRLLFVMTRIGAAMAAAPLFGATSVPAQLRVALAGAIGVFVCAWTQVQPPAALLSASGLLAVGGEVLVGLALGFVLQVAFAAPMIAAETIAGSMGLGLAASIDPASGTQSTALGQYLRVVLTLVFFGLGAHLRWLGLVFDSYRALPPGRAWLAPDHLAAIAGLGGEMFATAVAMALPVVLVLLLVQVLTGVLSRSAPALNLFALGLPAGVLAGLAALIVAAPLLVDQCADLVGDALTNVLAVLRP